MRRSSKLQCSQLARETLASSLESKLTPHPQGGAAARINGSAIRRQCQMGEEAADLNAPPESLRANPPQLLLGPDGVRLSGIVCQRVGNPGRRDDVLLRAPKPGQRVLRPSARDDVPREQGAALRLSVR